MTNIFTILLAVYAFVAKYGPAARPIIESVLSAALASGKISQGAYDAIEAVLNALLGPAVQRAHAAFATASGPTEAEFKTLAGL